MLELLLFCSGYSLLYPCKQTGDLADMQRQGKILLLGMLLSTLPYQPRTNLLSMSLYKKDPKMKTASSSTGNTPIGALKHTGSFDPLDF